VGGISPRYTSMLGSGWFIQCHERVPNSIRVSKMRKGIRPT